MPFRIRSSAGIDSYLKDRRDEIKAFGDAISGKSKPPPSTPAPTFKVKAPANKLQRARAVRSTSTTKRQNVGRAAGASRRRSRSQISKLTRNIPR